MGIEISEFAIQYKKENPGYAALHPGYNLDTKVSVLFNSIRTISKIKQPPRYASHHKTLPRNWFQQAFR